MKILFLDIETAPNKVYVWGLFNQNVAPSQIIESHKVLCWAAKWHGEKEMKFNSINQSSEKDMLAEMHGLLNEADVVVHYHGTRFDIPHLNAQFIKHGMQPPSPYKQVDLKKVSRDQFRFPSNKLEYVAKALGIGEKIKEDVVFELWVQCMAGDEKAWKKMEAYNKMDVRLLERLYDKYKPWIKNHPNQGSYNKDDKDVCPTCGSKHYQRRGTTIAKLIRYARFQCQDCGTWFRSNMAIPNKKIQRNVGI